MAVSPIPEIIADMRAGKMVILVDEEDRENEGDLVLAADFVTPARCRQLSCMSLHSLDIGPAGADIRWDS